MQQITPAQLAAWLADGSREKPVRMAEIDAEKGVVAICHHGGRSMQVAMFLEKQGFKRVHNLVGGIDAWSRTVDPAVPLY